jgi:PAS domain S-box-containing protein
VISAKPVLSVTETYQQFFDQLEVSALMLDRDGCVLSCNPAFERLFGYRKAELVGRDWLAMAHSDQAIVEERKRFISHVNGEQPSMHFIRTMRTRDGRERVMAWDVTALYNRSGECVATAGIGQDITEQVHQRDSLRRSNFALMALSNVGNALVRAKSEGELVQAVCDAVTKGGVYPAAFFARKAGGPDEPVRVTATSGEAGDELRTVEFHWSDTPKGRGPAGTALRTGQIQILDDIQNAPAYAPWRELIRGTNWGSTIALPIALDGTTEAVFGIFGRATNAFGPEEIALFEDLARDIGFGIKTLRVNQAYSDAQRREIEHANALNAQLSRTIGAVVSMAEQRDPYTTQHQGRVAELARAIGKELGVDDHALEGIYLAATLHDIGKIAVPSEILTKARRLTAAEFELVKVHPTIGFDILKDIEFPWLIAEMVHQHHEGLDGSGYPRGLKGDEILLGSRIITVADVVDAVAADRPYRSALGVDKAKDIIREAAGSKLDPDVVRACIALLDSGRFRVGS